VLEKERDKYLSSLKQLEVDIANFDEEKDSKDISDLEHKKEELAAELAALQAEERMLDDDAQQLAEREEKLLEEEKQYWDAENKFEYRLRNYLDDNAQMKSQWTSMYFGI
jgi:vacuolar-type H+-ATPase subunit I/STV1